MKPHLCPHIHMDYAYWPQKPWKCGERGGVKFGVGRTPQEAYDNWRDFFGPTAKSRAVAASANAQASSR